MIVALAGVLELNLHEVSGVCIARHIGQPVVGIQLTVLSTYGMLAQSAVATSHYHEFFFHILFFNLQLLLYEKYYHL
jgi:hypothetical protein